VASPYADDRAVVHVDNVDDFDVLGGHALEDDVLLLRLIKSNDFNRFSIVRGNALCIKLNSLPGNCILQSSHSRAFQQYVLTAGFSLKDRLLLSQPLRHSICICFIVPSHLQGAMRGSSSVFSSPRQILQTRPSWVCFDSLCFNGLLPLFKELLLWSALMWKLLLSCSGAAG